MSTFWSAWVIGLTVFNLGLTFFLFVWGQRVEIPTLADGTSGHTWAHGALREGVRRLPLWWAAISGSMFVIGAIYLVLYPGFGANPGILGWTAHRELHEDMQANLGKLDPLLESFRQVPVEELAGNPAATRMGQRLFIDNCAACHGREGHGNQLLGAPDLMDKDWLYGGAGEAIMASIVNGRSGTMPPWESLGDAAVKNLAQYVLSLSGQPHDAAAATAGKAQFAICSACHGADGTGNQALGAPNLTDGIWLYGGTPEAIERSIRRGRSGRMPPWRDRLGDDNTRVIAAWIYSQANR
ncbi:MAG: cytochrome-c oxidase, cbb3-type subunit III [Gammaproteobacteria bacterium]|nr:cytochrome-c oxidase, cbb3-type subunit III [Gammaproteobacteria bacterium]